MRFDKKLNIIIKIYNQLNNLLEELVSLQNYKRFNRNGPDINITPRTMD
jgi:hypothetical protein